MNLLSAIVEALQWVLCFPPQDNDQPASRVGESETERKTRNFWRVVRWVLFIAAIMLPIGWYFLRK
jgi:hypothetical protein